MWEHARGSQQARAMCVFTHVGACKDRQQMRGSRHEAVAGACMDRQQSQAASARQLRAHAWTSSKREAAAARQLRAHAGAEWCLGSSELGLMSCCMLSGASMPRKSGKWLTGVSQAVGSGGCQLPM
ncbi:hypothetical protein ACOSP7_013527 [Xanthoceras sorbifolium]